MIHDFGVCTENILLQETEEELGCVWVVAIPHEKVTNKIKEILNLDKNSLPFAMVPIVETKFLGCL